MKNERWDIEWLRDAKKINRGRDINIQSKKGEVEITIVVNGDIKW